MSGEKSLTAKPSVLDEQNPGHPGESPTKLHEPTVRLHLWLEKGDEVFFGAGRALLLAEIEKHGSLSKAAEELGMSYRAAWGKIRKTEKVLGVKLIAQNGCRKEGHRLTEQGLLLKEQYLRWFQEIEKCALSKAAEIFPWRVKGYRKRPPAQIRNMTG